MEKSQPSPLSQLLALPFIAGVEGILNRELATASALRVTLHRPVVQNGRRFLQQACAYVGAHQGGAGRLFPMDEGVVGASFRARKIYRTRGCASEDELMRALDADMRATGDLRAVGDVPRSYLSVPFLQGDGVALVLYADCRELNFFSDDERVSRIVAMCEGFCRFLDRVHQSSDLLACYPATPYKENATGGKACYPTVQEELAREPPRFERAPSFDHDLKHKVL